MRSKKTGDGEMMSHRERAVCCTLCIFLAVSVLSSVALVYLTVIIYLPAQRELQSGIGETSVMCTTNERKKIADDIAACKWSSCSEWCLSKGGGACTHIYASVRNNGTNIDLEECTALVDKTCSTLDWKVFENLESGESLNLGESSNCKEDRKCTSLDKLFQCENGRCINITSAYACDWDEKVVEPPVNCEKKRNCVELGGQYNCVNGWCSRIGHWSCERRCTDVPTPGKNVLLMAGDRMVLANCRRAVDSSSGETVWSADNHLNRALLASCTSFGKQEYATTVDGHTEEIISATDCINGTLLPTPIFEKLSNHSALVKAIQKFGPHYKLDDRGLGWIPYEEDLMIFNQSRLMINHEGCVNTLQGECSQFYDVTGNDGRNDTSRSRFPCYYAPSDPEFVVLRYDPFHTRWLFFIGFLVPASLLIVSCGVLFTCSRILNVDNAGRMNLHWCTTAIRKRKQGKNEHSFGKEYTQKQKKNEDESAVTQMQLTTSGTLLGYDDDTGGDPL